MSRNLSRNQILFKSLSGKKISFKFVNKFATKRAFNIQWMTVCVYISAYDTQLRVHMDFLLVLNIYRHTHTNGYTRRVPEFCRQNFRNLPERAETNEYFCLVSPKFPRRRDYIESGHYENCRSPCFVRSIIIIDVFVSIRIRLSHQYREREKYSPAKIFSKNKIQFVLAS